MRDLLSGPLVIGWLAIGSTSCMPEQELASYRAGTVTASSSANPAPREEPDAGLVTTFGAVPDEPEPPAAVSAAVDTERMDAAPQRALDCSAACECERRDERDYMFCAEALPYDAAVERCADAGGTLVSIDDSALNLWLTERMRAALELDDFWLSGTDSQDEGVWRWQDGRVFFDAGAGGAGSAYAPWDEGQPNDLNGEDCMRSTAGVWRDLDCSELLPYACQG